MKSPPKPDYLARPKPPRANGYGNYKYGTPTRSSAYLKNREGSQSRNRYSSGYKRSSSRGILDRPFDHRSSYFRAGATQGYEGKNTNSGNSRLGYGGRGSLRRAGFHNRSHSNANLRDRFLDLDIQRRVHEYSTMPINFKNLRKFDFDFERIEREEKVNKSMTKLAESLLEISKCIKNSLAYMRVDDMVKSRFSMVSRNYEFAEKDYNKYKLEVESQLNEISCL